MPLFSNWVQTYKTWVVDISGLSNKLEIINVIQWLRDHDVVMLTETIRANVTHAPGFIPAVAINHSSQRGIVVLFKHDTYNDITVTDRSAQEKMWFQQQSDPSVTFGGAYIPPSDSLFSEIQARTQDSTKGYVVVVDMNTRCGKKVSVK